MTEPWKSNAKKFCEICKCWLNDNRASIEFHENGKRHQENVQKRLQDIQRKTRTQEKDEKRANKSFNKIEKAALEAYKADKEANPDISLKIQAYDDYLLEQKKGKTDGQVTEKELPTVAKILHRDEKKQKKDDLIQEQLKKPLPAYSSKGGWKSMSSTTVSVDLELPQSSYTTHQPTAKKGKYDFEERTVGTSMASSTISSPFAKAEPESISFKKRKFTKSNLMRKRDSDDDE